MSQPPSSVASMTNDFVKIHVRFPEGSEGPAGESPWAEPVDATDAGGIFRLQNDLFYTPLRHGDLVRCQLDADSILQVVEILDLVPGVLLGFEHPRGTDAVVKRALEAQIGAGNEVNRPCDGFAEVFFPGVALGETVMAPPIPAGWTLMERLDADGRREQALRDINLNLNTTAVMNHEPIEYWAADDPAWAELGADDPDLLGVIQTLAAQDLRVLATIQAGRHRDVLTYMERLSTPDPRDLPPLDRPLLVDSATTAEG